MKKLKFLAFLMMGIIACFGMTSCGDDDDDDDFNLPEAASGLIGTWTDTYTENDYDGVDVITETFTFKKNGKFDYSMKCKHYNDKVSGTYTVTGNLSTHAYITMTARVDGETEVILADAYLVGNNTLVMTNDEGETYRLTRK